MNRSKGKKVQEAKSLILQRRAEGFKPTEIARVIGLDVRTIKSALDSWSGELLQTRIALH